MTSHRQTDVVNELSCLSVENPMIEDNVLEAVSEDDVTVLDRFDVRSGRTRDGKTLFGWACQIGSKRLVERIFDRYKKYPLNETYADGMCPLILACSAGHGGIVRSLLDAGASPQASDVAGRSALHIAALCGFTDIVKELLTRKFDVNSRTRDARATPLHLACSAGNVDVARSILSAAGAAEIDAKDVRDNTALMHALKSDNVSRDARLKLISLLVHSHGANPNICDEMGMSPLHVAAMIGDAEAAKCLLKEGANVSKDRKGRLPSAFVSRLSHASGAFEDVEWGEIDDRNIEDLLHFIHCEDKKRETVLGGTKTRRGRRRRRRRGKKTTTKKKEPSTCESPSELVSEMSTVDDKSQTKHRAVNTTHAVALHGLCDCALPWNRSRICNVHGTIKSGAKIISHPPLGASAVVVLDDDALIARTRTNTTTTTATTTTSPTTQCVSNYCAMPKTNVSEATRNELRSQGASSKERSFAQITAASSVAVLHLSTPAATTRGAPRNGRKNRLSMRSRLRSRGESPGKLSRLDASRSKERAGGSARTRICDCGASWNRCRQCNCHDAVPLRRFEAGSVRKPIVIDASNVCRHDDGNFVTRRLCDVIRFYEEEEHRYVLAFVPRSVVFSKNAKMLADDVKTLHRLRRERKLVFTPSDDYDDSYILQFAMKRGSCVVSNDLFRDAIAKWGSRISSFLRIHRISFTFACGEFLPNPDFMWPEVRTRGRRSGSGGSTGTRIRDPTRQGGVRSRSRRPLTAHAGSFMGHS